MARCSCRAASAAGRYSKAPRLLRLRRLHAKALFRLFQTLRNAHNPGLKVEIGPLKGQQFAAAGARSEVEQDQRVKAGRAGAGRLRRRSSGRTALKSEYSTSGTDGTLCPGAGISRAGSQGCVCHHSPAVGEAEPLKSVAGSARFPRSSLRRFRAFTIMPRFGFGTARASHTR